MFAFHASTSSGSRRWRRAGGSKFLEPLSRYSTHERVELFTELGIEVPPVLLHPRRRMAIARDHHHVLHSFPPAGAVAAHESRHRLPPPATMSAVAVIDPLCREEIPIGPVPVPRLEIPPQPLDPRLDLVTGQGGEGRTGRPDSRVEVHLGPAPKCRLEAVGEVVRDLERRDGVRAERGDDMGDEREASGFHGPDGGDIVRRDPQQGPVRRVPGEDHLTAADPAELGEPAIEIVPVMHGEDGHGHVEGGVVKWQMLGRALDPPRPPMLGQHHGRRLDGDHGAVRRLVGPRAGADVHDGLGVADGPRDHGGQAGIGPSDGCVADADAVVGLRSPLHRPILYRRGARWASGQSWCSSRCPAAPP